MARLLSTRLGPLAVEETGRGPPLLLWHSLLCDGSMWREQVLDLARDHRVVVVDGPGHGASPPPRGPFTLEDCAAAALELLDALAIERAALLGLSWGGMTFMRLALAAPERVRALALLDTSADPEQRLKRIRYRVMAAIYRRFGLVRPLERPVLQAMLGATTLRERPELGRELLERLRGWDRAGVARAVDAVVIRRASIAARLASIRAPTLVLVGEEDRATGVRAAERIARGIPGARLVRVPRAGHLSTLEAPGEVTRHLREFLAAV